MQAEMMGLELELELELESESSLPGLDAAWPCMCTTARQPLKAANQRCAPRPTAPRSPLVHFLLSRSLALSPSLVAAPSKTSRAVLM